MHKRARARKGDALCIQYVSILHLGHTKIRFLLFKCEAGGGNFSLKFKYSTQLFNETWWFLFLCFSFLGIFISHRQSDRLQRSNKSLPDIYTVYLLMFCCNDNAQGLLSIMFTTSWPPRPCSNFPGAFYMYTATIPHARRENNSIKYKSMTLHVI